jgi:hypothetical protein
MNATRKKLLLLAAIALALLGVIVVILWSSPGKRETARSEELERLFDEYEMSDEEREQAYEGWGNSQVEMKRKKLIGGIRLEKKKVCPDEDLRVDLDRDPAYEGPVSFNIVGLARGNPTILRFRAPGVRQVFVSAGDGRYGVDVERAMVEVLPADHPDCANRLSVTVKGEVSRFRGDSADIQVTGVQGLGEQLTYTYDFGDGSNESTGNNFVSHSYALRDQIEPWSSFLITVTVRDEHGREARGRTSVYFNNNHLLATSTGNPTIPVEYDRFPEKKGGGWTANAKLKNIEKDPINFTAARLFIDSCRAGEEIREKSVSLASVVNTTTLSPRSVTEARISISESDVPATACRVEVRLTGDTSPPRLGEPVGPGLPSEFGYTTASMFFEIAPPPTADQGGGPHSAPVTVTNEKTIEKLDKAREILGDRPITPQDMLELERKGLL